MKLVKVKKEIRTGGAGVGSSGGRYARREVLIGKLRSGMILGVDSVAG